MIIATVFLETGISPSQTDTVYLSQAFHGLAVNGFLSQEFGSVSTAVTIDAIGINDTTFGGSSVSAHIDSILPDGMDTAAVGLPYLSIAIKPDSFGPIQDDLVYLELAQVKRLSEIVRLRPDAPQAFFGFASIQNLRSAIAVYAGINSEALGLPSIKSSFGRVDPLSIYGTSFGFGSITNFNKTILPYGFDCQSFGFNQVENLKRFVVQLGDWRDQALYGTAYLQGGVKYIAVNEFDSNVFGATTVINTRAEQYLQLSGIVPPLLANPNVSPRILYPFGIKADGYGQPLVQRNPSPNGFINSSYGDAWVSHSPRYLLAGIGDSFISGYPQVFDPTRTIYLADKGIEGGIFGDTAVKNTRRIIAVDGFQDSQFSSFATIYSTRRYINATGIDAQNFGNNEIYNKTPSLAPTGFDSLQGLNPSIGYTIRHIYPAGFDLLKTGNAVVIKTPEIKPGGLDALSFGALVISNHTRSIEVAGINSQNFGELTIWHRLRRLQHEGFTADSYGNLRIEHSRRALLALGSTQSLYGQPWLSYAVRSITAGSIYTDFASNHKIGGLQFIDAQGFVATEFGTRITPEVQSLAPFGFSNSYGLATIDLKTKYVAPQGFKTIAQEALRFGTSKFYNLVQYITQNFDSNSGLVPPQWPQWTLIENRNKIISAIGSEFAKVGEPNLYNNARLIEPSGIDSFKHSGLLIADRIRYVRPDGQEPPYISSWSNIHNDARVIQGSGFDSQVFGSAATEKTRRYLPRVGNWESLEFGLPMIADAIRTIDIESRYGISPPYIPVPDIYLYRRYLDEVGKDDHLRMGEPSLSIHFNIIAPRWSWTGKFGDGYVYNVTPEVQTFGSNSELFGEAKVRTSFRVVAPNGALTQMFGLTGISDRTKHIVVVGMQQMAFGDKLKVIKTGAPPYSLQYIWLDRTEVLDNSTDDYEAYGIKPPVNQVSPPKIKTNVIKVDGFIATEYGKPFMQSNGILVYPGIQELSVGTPHIRLKNRKVLVESVGDTMVFGAIAMSPHTIYATRDVPAQASNNHPNSRPFEEINSDGNSRPAGEIFGLTTVALKHRIISAGTIEQAGVGGGHSVQLSKRYLDLTDYGIRSNRFGFHVVGPFNQTITQFDSEDSARIGLHHVSRVNTGNVPIQPKGIPYEVMPKHEIQLLHRELKPGGFDAQEFGRKLEGDSPFMWQGMRIGERVLGNYGGFDALGIGDIFISNKVRGIDPTGFDAFRCEYDYTNFNDRMRVTKSVIEKPKQYVSAVGFVTDDMGVLNIKPAAHYIRPDGNAEQYRKGGW